MLGIDWKLKFHRKLRKVMEVAKPKKVKMKSDGFYAVSNYDVFTFQSKKSIVC